MSTHTLCLTLPVLCSEIGLVCGYRCVHMTHELVFIVWNRKAGSFLLPTAEAHHGCWSLWAQSGPLVVLWSLLLSCDCTDSATVENLPPPTKHPLPSHRMGYDWPPWQPQKPRSVSPSPRSLFGDGTLVLVLWVRCPRLLREHRQGVLGAALGLHPAPGPSGWPPPEGRGSLGCTYGTRWRAVVITLKLELS